jgi:RNA-directed DNA polymerase
MSTEGRGLSLKQTQDVTKTEGLVISLTTPESVQKLQAALHDKAKKSPDFRFYALYDKVYRKDVLTFAFECSKANAGAAGVDDQTFEDIEAYGEERWLDELTQELKSRTYRPLPVRRVYIPKPGGKAASFRGARYSRPCGYDGGGIGARSYLRRRLTAGAVRLSAAAALWTQ